MEVPNKKSPPDFHIGMFTCVMSRQGTAALFVPLSPSHPFAISFFVVFVDTPLSTQFGQKNWIGPGPPQSTGHVDQLESVPEQKGEQVQRTMCNCKGRRRDMMA